MPRMTTGTPRPVGMRAELREWYFDDDGYIWYGLIYGDTKDTFRDGQAFGIRASQVLEVNKMTDITIIHLKSGERFFMLNSTELKRAT